jgi:hypothetical protein
MLRSVPAWGPPPRPELKKYLKGVTCSRLSLATGRKPGGNSCTTVKQRFYVPDVGINLHICYKAPCTQVSACRATGNLLIMPQLPPAAKRWPPRPLPAHYVGISLWSRPSTQTSVQGQWEESTQAIFHISLWKHTNWNAPNPNDSTTEMVMSLQLRQRFY